MAKKRVTLNSLKKKKKEEDEEFTVDLTLEQLMEDEEEPWQKQLKRLERDPASPPSRRTRSQKKEEEKREKMNNKSNEEFAVHYQRQVTLLLKELRQESIMLQISTKNATLQCLTNYATKTNELTRKFEINTSSVALFSPVIPPPVFIPTEIVAVDKDSWSLSEEEKKEQNSLKDLEKKIAQKEEEKRIRRAAQLLKKKEEALVQDSAYKKGIELARQEEEKNKERIKEAALRKKKLDEKRKLLKRKLAMLDLEEMDDEHVLQVPATKKRRIPLDTPTKTAVKQEKTVPQDQQDETDTWAVEHENDLAVTKRFMA